MKKFEISTDSTCDFYAEEYKKYDIYVGKLTYTIEENNNLNEYLDDFKCYDEYVEYYNRLRKGGVAKTAILNLQAHIDLFTEMAEKGIKTALHITQSVGLSPTIDNANKAIEIVKEKYPDINYVAVESRTTTIGEGLIVKMAIKMRDSGKTLAEAVKFIEENKCKMQHFIVVDDLMYLKRGGRVSGVKAAMGTLLKLKPIIQFTNEGKLEIVRKEMGVKKAYRSIVEEAKKFTEHKDSPGFVIVHTDNLEGAKELQALILEQLGKEAEIRIMGPIVGAHVGPNAVAFGFLSNELRPY